MQQALHSHQGHLPAGGGWPLQLDNGGPLTACLRDAILQILRGLPVSHDASVGAPLEEAPVDIPLQTKEEISGERRSAAEFGHALFAFTGCCLHTAASTRVTRHPQAGRALLAEETVTLLLPCASHAGQPKARGRGRPLGLLRPRGPGLLRPLELTPQRLQKNGFSPSCTKLRQVSPETHLQHNTPLVEAEAAAPPQRAERDKTRQRLRQQEIATREAQQKYIEHRDRASTLAQRVVHDLKERRLMSNQLAEVEQKLLEERETRRRLEADKKNLASLRTIARLRGKLEEAKSELATARLEAGLIDSERQRAEQQTEVFRHNIKGMGDLQRNLTEELAEARERVSSVKRAFREKIGQLQSEHEEWRKIIESHQQTVKHWEDKYQESQAQVEAAHGSMDRLRQGASAEFPNYLPFLRVWALCAPFREHMDQLQIFASDLAAEKEETHTQLRKQIQLNEQLQAELTEVTEQLLLQDQKRKQQQQKWRQEHLSAVDRCPIECLASRSYSAVAVAAGVVAGVAAAAAVTLALGYRVLILLFLMHMQTPPSCPRKTEARKFALKFTEAAVQADAASSRSDDTPADTPGPHNSKAPPSLGPPKGCWVRND
ncbi:hypothetical protein Esti_005066 [Eimeria stiedai]